MSFFKYDDEPNQPHSYSLLTDEDKDGNVINLSNFTWTNSYLTKDGEEVNFMTPFNVMRSFSDKYLDLSTSPYIRISSVPFFGINTIRTEEELFYLLELINLQHDSIKGIITRLTNNFNIDLKVFNTYGRSRMFMVDNGREMLDRVNLKIQFKVAPVITADAEIMVS